VFRDETDRPRPAAMLCHSSTGPSASVASADWTSVALHSRRASTTLYPLEDIDPSRNTRSTPTRPRDSRSTASTWCANGSSTRATFANGHSGPMCTAGFVLGTTNHDRPRRERREQAQADVNEEHYHEFAHPYLKRICDAFPELPVTLSQ